MAPVDGTDTPDAVVAVDSMSIAEPLVRTDMAADSTLVAAADFLSFVRVWGRFTTAAIGKCR